METFLIFLLTPWIFITLIFTGIIGQLILIEYEKFRWNTFILILLLILVNSKYDLVTYIMNNPLETLLYTGSYFTLGLIWSFGKWYSKISKIGRKIKNVKKRFQLKWGLEKFNGDILRELGFSYYTNTLENTTLNQWIKKKMFPKASNNKALIIAWIIYWPFSLISTIINNPIKRLANWLYHKFSGVYEGISEIVLKETLK